MISKKNIFTLLLSLLYLTTASQDIPEKKNRVHELQKKLAYNPIDYTTHFQLGNEFFKIKQYNQAIIHYKKSLQQNPQDTNILYNLGLTYLACKNKLEKAKELFVKITQLEPNNYKAFYKIATIFEKNNQINEAITYYKKTIKTNPQCTPAHTKLGILYNSIQNPEKALHYLEKASELDPNNISLLSLMGNILNNLGQCDQAAQKYIRASELSPNNHIAFYNAGYSLKVHGNIDQAIQFYNKALEIKPEYDSATYAIALAYLYKGDFKNGWKYYQHRLIKEKRNAPKLREYIKTNTLGNKTIYLVPEGGLGDTIQFIRYVQLLKEEGANVYVAVQKPLYNLLKNCTFIDHLLPFGTRVRHFDDHASIMSLPAIFETTEETIPKNIPYIFPDKTLEEKWENHFNSLSERHKKNPPFRIGLCWQADLKNDESRLLCAHRSIPLEKLEKLSQIPNIEFYSLQKNITPTDIDNLSENFVIHNFGDNFDTTAGPFMDTAAIMKQLDLIITVDTSIAHLAGAIGANVWVMLPYNTDWRWIAGRKDSPWYPKMKLFKQPKAFDWDSVVETIFQELYTILNNTSKSKKSTQTNIKQTRKTLIKQFEQANKAFENSNFENAIEIYKKILDIGGQIPGIHFNIGKSYCMLKKFDQAIKHFKKTIELDPNYQKAYQALGEINASKKQYKTAKKYLKKAIELNPNDYISQMNFGSNLLSLQLYEHAEQHYKYITTLFPDRFEIIYNAAYAMKLQGKYQEAIPYYQKTIELNPTFEEAYLGLAKTYLATGKLLEGWNYFEWRFFNSKKHREKFNYQSLTPQDLAGKILYIQSEWGLGDMMHFIRYLELAKNAGATIYLQIHKPLEKLFSLCPYIDKIFPQGTKPHSFDIQIPVMSLPLIFKTTLNTVPKNIPYLHADKTLVQLWEKKLSEDKNFKVGICWHAKPIFLEENYLTKRSVPLNDFAILGDIPNISFYSLQKIYGVTQLENTPDYFNINTFCPDFDESHGRFMDTAAVIQNLDLVITADTSIVHLAGALGKPVWILIPYVPEWRWMQNTDTTPWYPNARLFRQTQPKDWTHVMKKVKKQLQTTLEITSINR